MRVASSVITHTHTSAPSSRPYVDQNFCFIPRVLCKQTDWSCHLHVLLDFRVNLKDVFKWKSKIYKIHNKIRTINFYLSVAHAAPVHY